MAANRHYQKGNPEIETKDCVATSNNKPNFNTRGIVSVQNLRYSKPEATKLPHSLFVIYSGGTEREKDYFRLVVKNSDLFPFIRIAFYANPNFDGGGKPTIVKFAKEKTIEYQESASEENSDHYFLVTDVDHFEDFLPEMRRECNENNIELIISNSCFEVWLYYAVKSNRPLDFVIPKNKLEISSSFKTWANTLIKGGLKPTKAIFNIEQNIVNAKNNYEEESGIPTLFSTQMFMLAEQMLPFVNKGLEQLKEENERKRIRRVNNE